MKSDKKLWKICEEIYRKMYKEAGTDFDKLEKTKEQWFMAYYLPEKRQVEIVESVLEKHKCSKLERKKIRFEVYLGCAPSCVERRKKK